MKEKKRSPLLPALLILAFVLLGFGAWFFWRFCFETIVPDEVMREEAVRGAEERLRAASQKFIPLTRTNRKIRFVRAGELFCPSGNQFRS